MLTTVSALPWPNVELRMKRSKNSAQAIRHKPDHVLAHNNLGLALRQTALAARLPAVLRGDERPRDHMELLAFASLCLQKKLSSSSARLWSEAFRTQPSLSDDMKTQNRYNAACAMALAGCGQGKDEASLDEASKAVAQAGG